MEDQYAAASKNAYSLFDETLSMNAGVTGAFENIIFPESCDALNMCGMGSNMFGGGKIKRQSNQGSGTLAQRLSFEPKVSHVELEVSEDPLSSSQIDDKLQTASSTKGNSAGKLLSPTLLSEPILDFAEEQLLLTGPLAPNGPANAQNSAKIWLKGESGEAGAALNGVGILKESGTFFISPEGDIRNTQLFAVCPPDTKQNIISSHQTQLSSANMSLSPSQPALFAGQYSSVSIEQCGSPFSEKDASRPSGAGSLEVNRRSGMTITCPFKGCSKKFAKTSNLRAHVRLHTGEKPYACSHPGCPKRFMWMSALKPHERMHTKKNKMTIPRTPEEIEAEKIFHCSHCDRRFARKTSLTNHERSHLNVRRRKPRARTAQRRAQGSQLRTESGFPSLGSSTTTSYLRQDDTGFVSNCAPPPLCVSTLTTAPEIVNTDVVCSGLFQSGI